MNSVRKIFFIECSAPHWINVATALQEHNVEVAYWTGWSHMRRDVESFFPATFYHDTVNAKKACDDFDEPYEFNGFDEHCMQIWSSEAQTVYDMMNRFDHSRDQTFVEKSILFSIHLTYWKKILDEQMPDLVVFSTPPHVVYDYIILALCRSLKIKTVMYEEATIYPPYCLAMNDYLTGSEELTIASKVKHDVSQTTLDIVKKLRGDYEIAKPTREVIAHEVMKKSIQDGIEGLKIRAESVKNLDNLNHGMYHSNEKIVNISSLYKQKGRTLRQSYKSPYANSQFMDQLIEDRIITQDHHNIYISNTTALNDISTPFVYVALAGQPERTSNPQAGIFTNQLLMVNIIAHSLPSGWMIAVREHPNQFHPEFAVNMCRSVEYYETLLRIPNVKLLSTNENPFEIIDKSQLIATSGGTTALEAIARDKPVLLFGNAWYRDCPGIFKIGSIFAMKDFWKKYPTINMKQEDFINYVEAITKGCFRGLGDYPPDNYPIDMVENSDNLLKTILPVLGIYK